MPEQMAVTLMGGPLDGTVLPSQPVTDDPGAYMIVPGELSRAIYEPDPEGEQALWRFRGWIG